MKLQINGKICFWLLQIWGAEIFIFAAVFFDFIDLCIIFYLNLSPHSILTFGVNEFFAHEPLIECLDRSLFDRLNACAKHQKASFWKRKKNKIKLCDTIFKASSNAHSNIFVDVKCLFSDMKRVNMLESIK